MLEEDIRNQKTEQKGEKTEKIRYGTERNGRERNTRKRTEYNRTKQKTDKEKRTKRMNIGQNRTKWNKREVN